MNSLEWLNNQKISERKEEISPHLPVSPRDPIKLLKNNIFYSDEEKNIYPLNKRLHPLGEVTGDTLDYKNSVIASSDSTNKGQVTASTVFPIPGACAVCWHRYLRAIPTRVGKPCFNCGSVN